MKQRQMMHKLFIKEIATWRREGDTFGSDPLGMTLGEIEDYKLFMIDWNEKMIEARLMMVNAAMYAWYCLYCTCMNVYTHERMNAWITTRLVWLYGRLTCMIMWMINLMEQDWTGKMESDPTSHHKHSAIFNGDDATRVYQNSDGVKPGVCSNRWGINISWENVPIQKTW